MPQFHKKVPFSTKKKKEQLKAKREQKKLYNFESESNKPIALFNEKNIVSPRENKNIPSWKCSTGRPTLFKRSDLPCVSSAKHLLTSTVEEIGGSSSSKGNKQKYSLKFRRLAKEGNKQSKLNYEPITQLNEDELEVDCNDFYPPRLDYPKRPPWKKNTSKAELDKQENRSFRLFCQEIDKSFDNDELSLYELNLETWRQLWRVTEMSDILLIIVDARFCAAQFPPYLYTHLVEKENKGVILILSKCDLLPPSLVLAWQDYFQEKFPKLIIVPFSARHGKDIKFKRYRLAGHASIRLIDACQKLIDGKVDLTSWRQKVEEEDSKHGGPSVCEALGTHEPESTDFAASQNLEEKRYKNGILTIGFIGHPNVGKSSVINALKGKKVVSVSRTPGHTKYFQTIFITKNVKLCDCPGLVFPSVCPKQLQVIIGSYPIAQVRDPLTSIHYIASRIDLPSTLKLNPNYDDVSEDEFQWTPFYICEAWAKKRGYFLRTKGGRPDVFRAANELLRFTLVGFKSITFSLKPPNYSKNIEKYENDPRKIYIELVQGLEDVVLETEERTDDRADPSASDTDGGEDSETEKQEESDSSHDSRDDSSHKSLDDLDNESHESPTLKFEGKNLFDLLPEED